MLKLFLLQYLIFQFQYIPSLSANILRYKVLHFLIYIYPQLFYEKHTYV